MYLARPPRRFKQYVNVEFEVAVTNDEARVNSRNVSSVHLAAYWTDAMSLGIICTQICKEVGGLVRTLDDIK